MIVREGERERDEGGEWTGERDLHRILSDVEVSIRIFLDRVANCRGKAKLWAK